MFADCVHKIRGIPLSNSMSVRARIYEKVLEVPNFVKKVPPPPIEHRNLFLILWYRSYLPTAESFTTGWDVPPDEYNCECFNPNPNPAGS